MAYTDEETLRLYLLMYRHYCIEGRTELMLDEPFELPHIENSDFEYGLTGWECKPASEGSITRGYIDGFSLLSQRYWPIYKGDTFASMKRSAQGPNRISQKVKALEPGRLYTLKLIAADLTHIDQNEKPAMQVALDGVEVVEALSFSEVFTGGVKAPGFGANYGTMYRIVFRAKRNEADLTISDWATDQQPGGQPDQELVCNYVQVRPYHPAL